MLRRRPIVALLTAEVLSTTGSQMTWFALPWFVLQTTESPTVGFAVVQTVAMLAMLAIAASSLAAARAAPVPVLGDVA